jgi:tRNA(Ile)-lysidine synthase
LARRPPAVARVLGRVTKTAREHDMFSPGDLVLVSVSGGPDSVCLLYSLWHLRRLFKIKLAVFHFDHMLRQESAKDAAYVRRVAERLSLPFHVRIADDRPGKGRSVEAWATVARGNALNEMRKELAAIVIAEGHTLDDQAETVLLNLVRGTGLEGMVGIRPVRGARPRMINVQPLIDVERSEVEAFCRALRLRPRRDPMNEDKRLLRAAIRYDVMPILERATGRAVKSAIVRTSENLRSDRDELAFQAHEVLQQIVVGERGGDVRFLASGLRGLAPPVASRVIRSAVYNVMSGDWAAPWTKDAIEAVLDLATGRSGRRRDLPNGMKAWRDREYVHVARPSPEGGVTSTGRGTS